MKTSYLTIQDLEHDLYFDYLINFNNKPINSIEKITINYNNEELEYDLLHYSSKYEINDDTKYKFYINNILLFMSKQLNINDFINKLINNGVNISVVSLINKNIKPYDYKLISRNDILLLRVNDKNNFINNILSLIECKYSYKLLSYFTYYINYDIKLLN